ncbi:DUF1707 SHOCT-like domain-containing protein [Spirilliplanes yamanashiensis]|uniref:DUF1707 SHOCT-like domain-containing protein n=1 Tax=Spirilliplanes yamanashiensis TaxID=42233 RepID=UPI00194F1559|nr:DUF1707 domain-containing protein [Spirilliplanes yamanashiensis]MDP9814678.1 hypothetical protein [Spirilliplanes yamanashiensis]
MTDPRQRASDADRQRVVAALERHTAAGRLTLSEYADRVDSVLAARTHGDLGAVTDDLPAEPAAAADPHAENRHLLVAFLLAALVVAVLAVLLGLLR